MSTTVSSLLTRRRARCCRLARLVPLDLREAAFPEGSAALTGWRHVPLTLLRDAEGAELLVPRSHAPTLAAQARRVAARLVG